MKSIQKKNQMNMLNTFHLSVFGNSGRGGSCCEILIIALLNYDFRYNRLNVYLYLLFCFKKQVAYAIYCIEQKEVKKKVMIYAEESVNVI